MSYVQEMKHGANISHGEPEQFLWPVSVFRKLPSMFFQPHTCLKVISTKAELEFLLPFNEHFHFRKLNIVALIKVID